MILPFPMRGQSEHPIVLINLEGDSKVLEDAEKVFPKSKRNRRSRLKSKKKNRSALAVFEVGSYSCSVALGLDDLERINPDVFEVSENISTILAKHYASGFGFLICQLRAQGKQHPIAYVHDLAEGGTYFVPCRHEHGSASARQTVSWDHLIYSVNSDPPDMSSPSTVTPGESIAEMTAKFEAGGGCNPPELDVREYLARFGVALAAPNESFRRRSVKGPYPNEDLYFDRLDVSEDAVVGQDQAKLLVYPPSAADM